MQFSCNAAIFNSPNRFHNTVWATLHLQNRARNSFLEYPMYGASRKILLKNPKNLLDSTLEGWSRRVRSENQVHVRVFSPQCSPYRNTKIAYKFWKWNAVSAEWRKLHYNELCNLCSQQDIISTIKYGRTARNLERKAEIIHTFYILC